MLQVAYNPVWFYGVDIVFDVVSALVLVLLSFSALRYYRLSGNYRHRRLALGFGVIAAGFLAKIFRNFIFYSSSDPSFITLIDIQLSAMFVTSVLIISRLFVVFGLFSIYSLYYPSPLSTNYLVAFLLVCSTALSMSTYYVFHLTSLLLLFFIAHHFYKRYEQKAVSHRLWLAGAFLWLSVSQLLFIFIQFSGWFYVFGEVAQLLGYASLLVVFILVRSRGKKKSS